jgi:hypothetical protein
VVAASFLNELLDFGRKGRFEDALHLTGAGEHRAVTTFASRPERVIDFLLTLVAEDRAAFIKAVAAYENTVGGVGSVTLLRHLLPFAHDPQRTLLDWILTNTRSYWFYSHGARSVSALDSIKESHARRVSDNLRRERMREAEAKGRKATAATGKLFNAVRRGDLMAVRSLLATGADPTVNAPSGVTLQDYAAQIGRTDLAAELVAASKLGGAAPRVSGA